MPSAQACDIIIDTKPTFGHCGIVTGIFNGKATEVPRGHEVLHATNSGIVEGSWGNGRAFCFRSNHITRAEAERVQRVSFEIRDAASYGAARAVFKSWSGSSTFGKGAKSRLEKYQQRMENHQGVLKNVYCSELVVVAYQLGLQTDSTRIETTHRAWIELDGKHTLPSTLRSWLQRHPTNWTCVGVVTGADLELSAV